MERLGYGGAAHKARRVGVAIAAFALWAGTQTAAAQTTPPPAAGTTDQAPSEAARRAALSPYRFILQNSTAPARKPTPAPAPAEKEKRPAAVEQAAVQPRSAAAPAPSRETTATAVAPEAAPKPAPEPVAALSRKPAEPPPAPVHREIIPIKTDEPRLAPALLRERPSGIVKVHFDVHPDGTTSDVKVLSSTNRALNRPSVDAVQGWKFEPVDEVLTVETEIVYNFDK